MSEGHPQSDLHAIDGFADAEAGVRLEVLHATRPAATLDLYRVATAMPQLGTVLWLYRNGRERTFPRARLMQQGVLLLEDPALAALADCVTVNALCSVTSSGPREWLEFRDVHNVAIAKLYLLPETDYLAWDAMLSGCGACAVAVPRRGWHAHAAFMRGAFTRLGAAWQARIVRLPLLRLSCLSVLGLRPPEFASSLGRRLAGAIVEDEQAAWCEA